MTLQALHGYLLGFAIIGLWLVIALWALVLRILRRDDAPLFWRVVSLAQILLGVQLVVGLVLLALGGRPGDNAGNAGALSLLFHLLYTIVFPLLVLAVGHGVARQGRYDPYSTFALVGFVVFGLTTRGWMVGIVGF